MRLLLAAFVSALVLPIPAWSSQGPASAAPPPGWESIVSRTTDLMIAGKDAEVIAIYEGWVAKHPTFADAHLMLGGAHESLAKKIRLGDAPGGAAAAIKHWETAAAQFRKALDLKGPRADFFEYRILIDVYGVLGLDRPDGYDKLVREGVKRYPSEPMAHSYMLTLLASRKEPLETAARAARAAIGRGADPLANLAAGLTYAARDFGRLYGESYSVPLLREASALLDEALKLDPAHAYAAKTKALVVELSGK